MSELPNPLNSLKTFDSGLEGESFYYSLPSLEESGIGPISKLPVSIRVVLESVLRNCDGKRVTEEDVKTLANWNAEDPANVEIPFVLSRIVLQDFTGVPLLVDLAAMRSAVAEVGSDPSMIEPLVPVDLVVDHSVQVDKSGTADSFLQNMAIEFQRNMERYEFLKWGQQAFETFQVVPPGIGIVHQVNLEYLAKVVHAKEVDGGNVFYPDTLVGTDSHTTMINGIGVVGWGVGGIEAESGMLGQPVYFLTPEVIGVNLTGALKEGVTATDLTLRITELLRKEKVVGKFVEFHGEGARQLSLADRATIANMAPEYGATMGYFPVDEKSLQYLEATGRDPKHVASVKAYLEAQGLFGIPEAGSLNYTKVVELDMSTIDPSVAGPKRPQDRIDVKDLGNAFEKLFTQSGSEGGFGRASEDRATKVTVESDDAMNGQEIGHGSVLIAAITSCTNTSNPSVMLAAGLLAKKAVEKGLTVNPTVKTSLAPGSRVVTDYLNETGLQDYLDKIGFNLVGYGCTTCIGNSGPLADPIEAAIAKGELVAASVLSGNRNFEARVHGSIKSNFLMSPPLVVAYALAGRVDLDLTSDPIGTGSDGQPVYLKDLWPSNAEIEAAIVKGLKPEMFHKQYSSVANANPEWLKIESSTGELYEWNDESTYIHQPPFFDGFSMEVGKIEPIVGMRPLAILGDSVTTDHISPAGAFKPETPAGKFLLSKGVEPKDFNSYGSRRGNDLIMTRGTFANVRVNNLMADGKEGGFTKIMPEGAPSTIFDACQEYKKRGTPLIVFAGIDYGMGSSRDWAAKGTNLLGVKAVVARSYERIHRSNLIGMGVLPLEFLDGQSAQTLGLDGSEVVSLPQLGDDLKPGQTLTAVVERSGGAKEEIELKVRVDTAIEVEYIRNGGILPYVLRDILKSSK
ncbi:aconitate hydratase AcnA [Pelagicoccus sp. SDUM812003]|uniref:aconitate hydratase AcnA n=1 Tax=Pelagicoccus sp. SDUM812003 TaxID=3041267 RepID=UPI00281077D0|nr:aconitate hydratase AcnA [Pelagicoccus sp. SDUM812003]MDQ8202599.1 aconitate hydratase AcnA [Pelagicoccus sp. SDUM812003]